MFTYPIGQLAIRQQLEFFDFWTVSTVSAYTYTMTIRGTLGEKIYIDWGDGSAIESFVFSGSIQTITHSYGIGTFQQRWSLNILHLQYLSASNQNLISGVPILLQQAVNLTYLFIEGNSFNTDLGINGWPEAINSWTLLTDLGFGNNSLTGDLSTWDLTLLISLNNFRLFSNNFTGDISGWTWLNTTGATFIFCQTNTFTGDISSWNLSSAIGFINFSDSPLTGYISDIGQSGMANLAQFRFRTCDLTGLNDAVDVFFENRASYVASTKSVWFNLNDEYLTGTYQQPDLGTYVGSIHDLNETQITNLSNGFDINGNNPGSTVIWSTLEKVWTLENLDTTSTSGVKRYGFSFTYDSGLSFIQIPNSGSLGMTENDRLIGLPNAGGYLQTDWTPSTNGLGDGWEIVGVGIATIVTGNGFTGNAQRIDNASGSSIILRNTINTVADYQIAVEFIYRASAAFDVAINISGTPIAIGTTALNTGNAIIKTTGVSGGGGVAQKIEFTIPDGGWIEVDVIEFRNRLTPSANTVGDFVPNTGGLSDNWAFVSQLTAVPEIATRAGFKNNVQKVTFPTDASFLRDLISDNVTALNGSDYILSLRIEYERFTTAGDMIITVRNSSNVQLLSENINTSLSQGVWQSPSFTSDDTTLYVRIDNPASNGASSDVLYFDEVELIEI